MKKHNSHIGVLGLGSRATMFYIDQLNKKYHAVYGGYSTCPFVLLNADFNDLNPFLPNLFDELKTNLLPYFMALCKMEIGSLILPNITLHETVDLMEVESNFQYSVIHPIESTLTKLKKDEVKEVVLFGSLYSMQGSYIKKKFKERGISIVLPTEDEMNFTDDFRKCIYENKETSSDLIRFKQLVQSYAMSKSVVIACTELSLVLEVMKPKVYDMARIQIANAF